MIDAIVDFLFDHPYLSTSALVNIFILAFFPESLATTALITATLFAAYTVYWAVSSFINWVLTDDYQPPAPLEDFAEEEQEGPRRRAYDNSAHSYIDSPYQHRVSTPPKAKVTAVKPHPLMKEFEDIIVDATVTLLSGETFKDVVIANDLRLYEKSELLVMEAKHKRDRQEELDRIASGYELKKDAVIPECLPSAYTREPLNNANFLFSYNLLTRFCIDNKNFDKLMQVVICPITNEVMENPVIAHFKYTNWYSDHDFILVCDAKALPSHKSDGPMTPITNRITLHATVECGQLNIILGNQRLKTILQNAWQTRQEQQPTTNLESRDEHWERLYAQSKIDFPPTRTNSPPVNLSSSRDTFYAGRGTGGASALDDSDHSRYDRRFPY